MILAYLFCLVSGGILITLSLTSDSGFDNDGTGGQLTLLFSTPFWSFSLCSFGLCGLLATLLAPTQPHLVVVAGLAGLSMGWVAAQLLRMIGKRNVNSLVRTDDLIGLEGRVTLAIAAGERGFVELNVKGSLIRRPARSCQGAIPQGAQVVVLSCQGHTLTVESL